MSDKSDDPLHALRELEPPAPGAAARQRALAAGLSAFEAAKTAEAKKSFIPPQGAGFGARLKSILSWRTWTMDYRLPLGTGLAALLLLPLGLQLYNTTVLTRPDAFAPLSLPAPAPVTQTTAPMAEQAAPANTAAATAAASQAPAGNPLQRKAVAPSAPKPATDAVTAEAAPPPAELAQDAEIAADRDAAVPQMNAAPAPEPLAAGAAAPGAAAPEAAMAPPPMVPNAAPMLSESLAQGPAPFQSGDRFQQFDESAIKSVAEAPVSTFSIDVDTASYAYVRRTLEQGYLPEPDAVRLEELINYFPYDYPAAASAAEPFKPTVAIYPTPWNPKTQILQIGIKGYVPPATESKPANLVFLVDTSGSMDEPDKLPLLKRAFGLLVDTLKPGDTVSIVAYAGSAGIVLEPTAAREKTKILQALDNLAAGGSTAGAEGIELAYQLAAENQVADGVNRVILATDGDFNVGIDDPEELKDYIKTKRDSGIALSVLGFGQGNLDDALMQALAQNGNGNASYIDSFREAEKVLVAEGAANLQTIAQDVKIQVEFNPAFVSEYRLIGYETRALNREDFNNDKVDAGDIGAGHTVTALYEITPAGAGADLIDPLRFGTPQAAPAPTPNGEIAYLKMRYKLPGETESKLMQTPITPAVAVDSIAKVSDDMRWAAAVAAFGQTLKGSVYGTMPYPEIRALAQSARGTDPDGYRAEFIQLLGDAQRLSPR